MKLLTWEEVLYKLSALGFMFEPDINAWRNHNGVVVTDESLRDIHTFWPMFVLAAFRLWGDGAKVVTIESSWENGSYVARIKVVE